MKINKKKNLTALLITLILCSLCYYHYHKNRPFRCDAQLVSHIEQNGVLIDISLNASMVFFFKDKGIVSFKGSVTQDGKNYHVSRSFLLTTTPLELNGFNKTIVTSEEIRGLDNLPAGLWNKYILTSSEIYTQKTAVNKNGFVFQDLSSPYFVCVSTDN